MPSGALWGTVDLMIRLKCGRYVSCRAWVQVERHVCSLKEKPFDIEGGCLWSVGSKKSQITSLRRTSTQTRNAKIQKRQSDAREALFLFRCLYGKKARMKKQFDRLSSVSRPLMENTYHGFPFIIKHGHHLKHLTGVALKDLCKHLLLWSRCSTQESCWLASCLIAILSMYKKKWCWWFQFQCASSPSAAVAWNGCSPNWPVSQ